jgi:CheY-like chemotaxis protein
MKRIMVVDDDPVSLNLQSHLVRSFGFEVFPFLAPEEAIDWCRDNPVDVIVTDYEMPKCCGLELTKRVAEFTQVPVILVTAYGSLKVLQEAWKLGVFDFIEKPISPKVFSQTIHLALGFGHVEIARPQFAEKPLKKLKAHIEADILDYQIVDGMIDNIGEETFRELVLEFKSYAAGIVRNMARCQHEDGAEEWAKLIHKLKGSAANMGFTRLESYLDTLDRSDVVEEETLFERLNRVNEYLKQGFLEMERKLASLQENVKGA